MAPTIHRPVIGLAMIVRDEADTIAACLQSITPHVDHVAILDTGSKDDTVRIIEGLLEPMAERGDLLSYTVGRFDWIDDFAAARRAAEHLLPDEVNWTVWADADDILHGADRFHDLAAAAPATVAALGFAYDYAQDPHGNTVCQLKRERLVRRGHGAWHGRVHEAQTITGGDIEWVPATIARWVHRKPAHAGRSSNTRNLKILRQWIKDEPDSHRLLAYLGTEEAGIGNMAAAARYYRRYIKLDVQWPEERAQVHRKLALVLFEQATRAEQPSQERRLVEQALGLAFDAIRVHPEWPDSYLTLAEAHYRLKEYQHAESHARRALELGAPSASLLILNPMDYTFQPRLVLAGALAEQGHAEQALEVAEQALELVPDDQRLLPAVRTWRARLKRDQVAAGVLAHVRTLVVHDEQEKALNVLEHGVPFFCVEHPDIVAARSQLRERLLLATDPKVYAEHYETGGSKPEDFHSDDHALQLAGSLPRAHFLLQGLAEQAAA